MDEGAMERAGAGSGTAKRFTDYRELVKDESVDVVAVCVPGDAHAEAALAAMDAGKAVFVEKPLALTMADADRMVARAAERGLPNTVGFNLRSHRLVEAARRIISSGRLGAIETVRTVWSTGADPQATARSWHGDRARGGGAMFEIGVHHVDLWRHFLGSEVERVQAASRSEAFDDQSVGVMGRMTNGVLASTVLCQRSIDQHEIEVFGQEGHLRFSCYRGDSLIVTSRSDPAGGVGFRLKRLAQRAGQFPGTLGPGRRGGDFADSYKREWEGFVGHVVGERKPMCTFEDGRRALAVVLASLESIRSGGAVDVAEVEGNGQLISGDGGGDVNACAE
jgi:predicted dehydrogenase